MLHRIQEYFNEGNKKYSSYLEVYEEKMIELQKRAAKIFILLFSASAILAVCLKSITLVYAATATVVAVLSIAHYIIFDRYVVNHRRSIGIFTTIYSVIMLKGLISVGAFLSTDSITFVAIDASMVLVAITIIIPKYYWRILGLVVLWSGTEHVALLIRRGLFDAESWSALSSYVADYLFLCLFALVVNITFSRIQFKEIEAEQKLLKLNRTDSLTGLFNRRYIEEFVDRVQTGAMIYIDLDNFKQVNDGFGHKRGDELLIWVSDILRQHFQAEDDCIARVGGDEFLIFLPKVTDQEMVLAKVERLLRVFPIVVAREGLAIEVSLSSGIAFGRGEDTTYEMLCEKADKAMYRAKKNGKGKAVVFEDEFMTKGLLCVKREKSKYTEHNQ